MAERSPIPMKKQPHKRSLRADQAHRRPPPAKWVQRPTAPQLGIDTLFQIIVECQHETEQRELYERLTAEGRRCRLLVL